MTARLTPGPLTVRDSHILQLLRGGASIQRVTEIGAYRRSWTTNDVDRVVATHKIPTPPGPPGRRAKAVPLAPQGASGLEPWTPPTVPDKPPLVVITFRMATVLDGLCAGLTNAGIGHRLHLTEDTVKTHVRRLLASLGARDRCHAVALALSGQVDIRIRHRTRKAD